MKGFYLACKKYILSKNEEITNSKNKVKRY